MADADRSHGLEIQRAELLIHTGVILCGIQFIVVKHLFYRCPENLNDDSFAIQLENETIFTTHERMLELFDFVECLITLGAPKTAMADGAIPYNIVCQPFGPDAIIRLRQEIKTSREIQIPLFLGQKREITEEEAKCCIISTLRS